MLIQIALTLTVLLAFCGLALDAGMMQVKKVQLQNAADAAALGAVYVWDAASPSAAWQAAKNDASTNGFTDGSNGVTVAQPVVPSTGFYANNQAAVQVTVSQVVNPIFFPGAHTISAQSIAIGGAAKDCSYLLSTVSTAQASLVDSSGNISGSCPVYLGLGYNIGGGSSNGPQYLVAGSSAGTGTVSPTAKTNVGTMSDPLSSIPPPDDSTYPCAATNTYGNNATVPGNQIFCGGLTLSGTVTLTAGKTFVVRGPLNIGSGAVTGMHVLIYMKPLADGTCGTITIAGSRHALSAQVSGPQQGILIYSDRSCPVAASSNGELFFNQTDGIGGTLDGILYLPGQKVYATQAKLQGVKYLGIVADWFNMTQGTFAFTADYSDLDNKTPFPGSGAVLVQ